MPSSETPATEHAVTSADGTRIAYWSSGTGPPLLLVHGTTSDHSTTWRFVLPEFAKRFTVLAMDRRGRGGSGDGPDYSLEREAEDIAAIADAAGEPVNVIGHSFGAQCAFEASLLTKNLRRLVLYEGVPLDGAEVCPLAVLDELDRLLEAGEVDEMIVTMLREVALLPPDQIELLRTQSDAWAVRVRNAGTIPRELRAIRGYTLDAVRFREMRTPTVLLVGSLSHARELRDARAVAEALPDARVCSLPGQQHAAMYTAPQLFCDAVLRFVT